MTRKRDLVSAFVDFCIDRRRLVAGTIAVVTVALAYFATHIDIRTVFEDQIPDHDYIEVHDEFKKAFGGSNMVSVMVEMDEGKGDIFQPWVLEIVKKLTHDLRFVDAVDQFQITSLATRKLREVTATTEGIFTEPMMFPDVPQTEEELENLRGAVLDNPLVYGAYVSVDLKSTLITMDFIDRLVDYNTVFEQVREIVDRYETDGIQIRVVGEPILFGWVNYYLPETATIALATVAAMVVLLFILARTWRGTLLPLLAGLVSATWSLGISELLGFHFDPLTVVVAFLITARSISHSVQLVTRFDDVIAAGESSSREAARTSMRELFRPGMLGVVADAGAIIVVVLTPIPLLQTVAITGTIWVATIAVGAVVLTPVLLSYIKRPGGIAHPIDLQPFLHRFLDLCVRAVTSGARVWVLVAAAVIFFTSGIYAFNLKVGDANPGSPILWQASEYNRDWARVNEKFRGSDRMFVVLSGDQSDTMKRPEVLDNIVSFQRYMEAQPEVGGTVSLADIIPTIKRHIFEGNPRYEELGFSTPENAEFMYVFLSGADPGDLDRYTDYWYKNASVTLFFRDRQGETIRSAIARINKFIEENKVEGVQYRLAGGLVGVMAAINEIIFRKQIESIALALLVVVICCAVVYRSTVAGMFFMVPIMISNTLTFSYMAWQGIGMNINTVPVAALGIGLGVDYAFYIIDGVKEELQRTRDPLGAISKSLHSAGRGVLVTAATLIVAVLLWMFSSLRFQAEMGTLMALWLTVSATSALFVMPSMAYIFRPRFVFGDYDGPERGTITPASKKELAAE